MKMAASKKKPVSKDDLRRLMKETKASVKPKDKRIDHPLAKYNSLDQLVCVLCNCVIKSDLLWPAHIQSRQHKEKFSSSKSQQTAQAGVKRKGVDVQSLVVAKKTKENGNNSSNSRIPQDFFENHSPKKPKSILKNSTALAAYSSSSSSEDEEDEEISSKIPSSSSSSTTAMLSSHPSNPSLPADFFDDGISTSENKEETDIKPAAIADVLPEGFFDDPKMDAKVRKVEYKDKMEEEWEMFQRAMKEESHVSEAIMEEEDEQINVDRNIDEIDDQMQRWKEINDLAIKKETITQKTTSKTETKESESSDELDEEDFEDFMNWRSKKSWK